MADLDLVARILDARWDRLLRTVVWTELVILGFRLTFPASATYVGQVAGQMAWWRHSAHYLPLFGVLTQIAGVAGAGLTWLSLIAILSGRLNAKAISKMAPASMAVRDHAERFLYVVGRETSGWFWALVLWGLAFGWPWYNILAHGWRLLFLWPLLFTPLFAVFTATIALAPWLWARGETWLQTVASRVRVETARATGGRSAQVAAQLLDSPELAHLRGHDADETRGTPPPPEGVSMTPHPKDASREPTPSGDGVTPVARSASHPHHSAAAPPTLP